MEIQELSQIVDHLLSILALLFPALAIYIKVLRGAKTELLKVLDQSPVNNHALYEMAKNLGQHKAAKAIQALDA